MKVILTKDVSGLGRAGSVKEISDGYFRNFLMPKHLALPATTSALTRLQKEEQERIDKLKRDQEKLNALKNQIENKSITIRVKGSDKKNLFAAVHEDQIVKALNEKLHLNLESKQIIIKTPVKSIGNHDIEVKLAENLTAKITLNIESV